MCNKNKENCELLWSRIFIDYINNKYGFDYIGKSVPNTQPALDVIAYSKSKKLKNLRFELTNAIKQDKTPGLLLFNNDCVEDAINNKEEKYKKMGIKVNTTILGIYYIYPETTNNSSFVFSIKNCFK